jgi:hypothetical protein
MIRLLSIFIVVGAAMPLAGPLITRYTDFAAQKHPFLRSAEIAYLVAFSGTTLLVGGYRIHWEWAASNWNRALVSFDMLLFVFTIGLLAVALRDLTKD